MSSIIQDTPFEFTRPITDPKAAVKRHSVLTDVRTALRRNEYVSILAPRQSGKTTLLTHLSRIEDACYVDFEASKYSTIQEVVRELAEKTGVESASDVSSPLAFFRRVGEARRFVFLLDELCAMTRVSIELLRDIRKYYNESVFGGTAFHKFVIAGSSDLADVTLDDDPKISPFNIAKVVYLEDFGADEVREFVLRRAGEAFGSYAEPVFKYTHGHPFLLQFVCHHLYPLPGERIGRLLSDVKTLVEKAGLETCVNIQSMVRHLLEDAGEGQAGLGMVERILKGEKVPFALSSPTVRKLYLEHGCIRNEQGFCAIRNEIYGFVLRRNLDIHRKTPDYSTKSRDVSAKELEKVLTSTLQRLLAGPVLVNYSGELCVRILDGEEVVQPTEGDVLKTTAGKELEMEVRLQPKKGTETWTLTEPVKVADGQDADEVRFEVSPDSQTVDFVPPRSYIKMDPKRASEGLSFRFTVPREPGQHVVWVQLFQQNRLAQAIRIRIDAGGGG
jgi:energy-coupling factor transporter ATP-binding protein EcfA2